MSAVGGAVHLPNHHRSLYFNPRLACSSPKPSKTLNFPIAAVQLNYCLCKSSLGFPLPVVKRSFKSKSKTFDGEVDSQNSSSGQADQKNISNMKTLIPIYKEAILDFDEKAVSEIEAMICIMEKEKNELIQKAGLLSADIAYKKDEYIHLQADFDNFRKRFEKDRLKLTSNTQLNLIESLLPLVDIFERANQQIRPETEKEKKIVTSYQGIYKQFVETMRSLGVAVIGTIGKPFDPALHEAIAREESFEYKEGYIIQEVRRGFLLGDRILRPAKVKVSAGPGRSKATTKAGKSIGQPIATAELDESSLPNR